MSAGAAAVPRQLSVGDVDADYQAFVDKFKPKKTTDDCYTPPEVYEAALAWAVREYGLEGREAVRPFFPGGDYERFEYPADCVVVDNPPFSILARVCGFYRDNRIDYFLFAPHLTCLNAARQGACCIPCNAKVEYENGAVVNTGFVTGLDPLRARSAPDLRSAVEAASRAAHVRRKDEEAGKKRNDATKARIEWPDAVLSSAAIGVLARHGVDLRIPRAESEFVRGLDCGRQIFGGGLLVTERVAQERVRLMDEARAREAREAALSLGSDCCGDGVPHVRVALSDREKALQKALAEHAGKMEGEEDGR